VCHGFNFIVFYLLSILNRFCRLHSSPLLKPNAPSVTFICNIVHYEGSVNECPIERVTFTSMLLKVVALKRSITLQRMKKVILRKLHREEEERVATMHFFYPTRLGGGVTHYTATEIIKDDDVEGLFNIYESIELQTKSNLYVTF